MVTSTQKRAAEKYAKNEAKRTCDRYIVVAVTSTICDESIQSRGKIRKNEAVSSPLLYYLRYKINNVNIVDNPFWLKFKLYEAPIVKVRHRHLARDSFRV